MLWLPWTDLPGVIQLTNKNNSIKSILLYGCPMNFIQALRNGLLELIYYMRLPSQNCPHIKQNRKLGPCLFSNLTVFQEAQLPQTEHCYLSFGCWSKCCIQCPSRVIYFCRLRNPRRRCWRGLLRPLPSLPTTTLLQTHMEENRLWWFFWRRH